MNSSSCDLEIRDTQKVSTATEIQAWLVDYLSKELEIPPAAIDATVPFEHYGLDSSAAIVLSGDLQDWLGCELEPELLFDYENIADLVEYLEDTINDNSSSSHTPLTLTSISREEDILLSCEQERLWVMNQLVPNNAAYNITQAIKLTGELDLKVLEESLNKILLRHEALRTVFKTNAGKPRQLVKSFYINLSLEDISKQSKVEQEIAIAQIADHEAKTTFDLSQGPLFKFKLIRLGETSHVLFLVFSHLVSDALSVNILIREISAFYEAVIEGKNPQLPELPVQYADFSIWQRQWLQTNELEDQLNYWNNKLNDIPPLIELPFDRPRPLVRSFEGRYKFFKIPSELWLSLKQLSKDQEVTPFVTLLTAFKVLLQQCTGQNDILVGSPTSGRIHSQLESLIGFFAYPLVLRTDLSGNVSFSETLSRVREVVKGAHSHQKVPLGKIAELLHPKSKGQYNPFFQVLFSFLGKQPSILNMPNLTLQPLVEASRTPTDMDLFITISETEDELRGIWEYNPDVFDDDTIQAFIDSYTQLLAQCVRFPTAKLSEFKLVEELEHKAKAAKVKEQELELAIAATFTAEPIADSLNFWLQELNIPGKIKFSPYNQIFQQLLDPASPLSQNQNGINIVLIRFEDWVRFENSEFEPDQIAIPASFYQKIARNVQDLIIALQQAAAKTAVPYLLCICPSAPTTLAEKESAEFCQAMELKLSTELSNTSNVYLITTKELSIAYPVEDYYDPDGDRFGHLPFNPSFLNSLGTLIARKIHSLHHNPYKVIVLDCDQTLWEGVCGEDGANGIKIDAPYKALQEFMIAQHDRGMLLCLCSKNSEEDVFNVFKHRQEMPLQHQHLVSWRINWDAKSNNLKSLAQELQVGLDSFIFIDDNPLECAEVKINCPEVLTLQLPEKADDIPQFIQHIWAFDRLKVTEEDRQRTTFYQQNIQRQQALQESVTLDDFINSLNLQVNISKLALAQIARFAQLTQRTNQFNATTIRRSEGDIQALYQSEDYSCLVVEVQDRFGDYGLVGAIIYTKMIDTLTLDTFLLSCRTLGRGVEHQMLAKLGKMALVEGLQWVEVIYHPTCKNQPILDFLSSVGKQFQESLAKGYRFKFPAAFAAEITYHANTKISLNSLKPRSSNLSAGIKVDSDLMSRIAQELSAPEQIDRAVRSFNQNNQSSSEERDHSNFVLPSTEIETLLARLWADLLHLEKIGIHDNFFELGGDSILGIQLISRANQAGLKLTPMQLFEHQTIAQLATVANTTIRIQTEQGLVSGSVPLTPIQDWFFTQNLAESHYFNQYVMLEVSAEIDPEQLKQVLQKLLEHHDALRLRFFPSEKGWEQVNSDISEQVPFKVVDYSAMPVQEQQENIKLAVAKLQASLNLSTGPMMQSALFNLGNDRPRRLLLTVHHLAVDGISWRILLEDLVTAYQQLNDGEAIQLPPKTTSFKAWAKKLKEYAQSTEVNDQLDYWLSQSHAGVKNLPVDLSISTAENIVAASDKISVSLTEEETLALLQEVPSTYNTQINDVLLTALVQSYAQWTEEKIMLIDLESHGREDLFEDVDISRTVGWFTSIFPVRLELGEAEEPGEALKSIKEQLRKVPNRGLGYGLLRYLNQNEAIRDKLADSQQAEISFNYLGQFDRVLSTFPILSLPADSQGLERSPKGKRRHLLEIIGFVSAGKLQLDWIYNKNFHQKATVEYLAQLFIEKLKTIIIHCQSSDCAGYTPSDFPEAELSQEELDELLAEID